MEWMVLGIVTASVVAMMLWMRRREKFTVHELVEPTCIPSTQSLPPNSDAMNVVLQPNTVRLAVQGYNYQTPPVFFRDNKKILPMEMAWDDLALTYFFTLAAPNGVCNHEWILETYEFVEPIVINQDTYTAMTVEPIRRRRGFNKWKLTCST